MRHWTIREASDQLSDVLREAEINGPQIITQDGEEAAVVLSMTAYRALTKASPTLYEFLRNSPLVGESLDFERTPEYAEVLDL